MKIFITGGTGSIGAHIVKMLSSQGHQIHVLARNLEKAKLLKFEGVKIFKGDIEDVEAIDAAIQGCEQAYHLAAYAKVWSKLPERYFQVNVGGTENILKACLKHKVKRIVVTSTAGALGPSVTGTITEDKIRDLDYFNEYESSKATAESKVKDYIIQYGLDAVIVSPTRVYGPFLFGESSSITLMIEKYINRKLPVYPGNGTQTGNYAYIEDVALGHLLAMEKGKTGELYLLGGENHNFVDFFNTLSEISGVRKKMRVAPIWIQKTYAATELFRAKYFGKDPVVTPKWISRGKYNWVLDASKAVTELGVPVTPLKEGLQRTVDRLRAQNSKK